jgi:hypothetical protein
MPWLAALAGIGEGAAAGAAGTAAAAAPAAAAAAAPAAAAAAAPAVAGATGASAAAPLAAEAASAAAPTVAANAAPLAAANALAGPVSGAGSYGVLASDVAAPAQGLTGVTTPVPFDPALATNSAIQASGVPSPMGAPGATGLGSSGPTAATGMGGGTGAPPTSVGSGGVWDKLGQLNKWMQKKGGALDDMMKPVGQVMNALDVLGVNKPPGKLPPIQSKLRLEPPPQIQATDPDAQRLAILQAFNMQG